MSVSLPARAFGSRLRCEIEFVRAAEAKRLQGSDQMAGIRPETGPKLRLRLETSYTERPGKGRERRRDGRG